MMAPGPKDQQDTQAPEMQTLGMEPQPDEFEAQKLVVWPKVGWFHLPLQLVTQSTKD